jgi:uncharacterized protein with PQ loop repeat
MDARELTGIALLVIQALIILPLIIELRRTRSAEGISITSEVAWVIAGVGWSIYGALTGSTILVISGALATAGSLAVLLLTGRDVTTDVWRKVAVLGAIFAVAMALSTVFFGAVGLAIFLSIFGLVQFVPQIVTSLRALRTRTGFGVPLIGTGLRAVYTATWAVYAGAWWLWGISFADIDWPLAVWGATGFVAFGLQCAAGLRAEKSPAPHRTRA